MSETPRVSVIIPCYNLGQYLDEAVASVLAQTRQDFEIIIVDDGSTDPSTQLLLADYQRPRTRVIRTAHRGVSAARNTAIASSTGAYLCALDADDRLEPTYFEKAIPVLDADASLAFVSGWLRAFGEEQFEWKPERCDLPSLLWEDTILTAALVRRDAVIQAGGYDEQMPIQGLEDWDLWLTLVERGARGTILPEVLFNYRRRAGSLSTVSWMGTGHVPLTGYRVAKHADAYRRHLLDVLLHQDDETADVLRKNDQLERYIASELDPVLASQRDELARLRARLASSESGQASTAAERGNAMSSEPANGAAARIRELEAALAAASAEVTALRTSMSWRVTGPLRGAYGRWLRWRGGP